MRNLLTLAAIITITALRPGNVSADVYTWTLDSAKSYGRLNFNDQTQDISTDLGTMTLTVRQRSAFATGSTGAGFSNAWNDTNGRKASLSGTFQADYVNQTSLTLLDGTSDISAVTNAALDVMPNPAAWDPSTQTYLDNSTAPADFASKVYMSVLTLVNANMQLAIRDFRLSLSSSQILLDGGTTIVAGSTNVGIPSASVQIDGTNIGGFFELPDTNTSNNNVSESNISGGQILNLGGGLRQLNLEYIIPLELELGNSVIITGTLSGVIVASTIVVPEVSPTTLAALGVLSLAAPLVIRRRRLRRD